MMNLKNWVVSPLDKSVAAELAETYGLPGILAMMLQIRGACDDESVNELIGEGAPLDDPFMLADMDKAVDRIIAALDGFERIAVYGDYDADGVTSTAIVYTYLQSKGADVIFYIPKREGEGYGMNMAAVDYLKTQDVKLIITVDNGISSVDEIEHANGLGMDVIVTDHHRPHAVLPNAVAVIDPYRPDCPSEFKDFAGAGVAFKLICAIETDLGDPDALLDEYADLAALGTIGDIVPLKGENRTLVKYGLGLLPESRRPGIRALMNKAAANDGEITSTTVAFTLVPRINATGRMGSPQRAVSLLICEEEDEALSLAEEICEENTRRRTVEAGITEKVIEMIEQNPRLKHSRVIVVAGEGWHNGVVGIVAARITDRYGKPCFIISSSGDESKGSGRSVEGFNLFDAVTYCSDILVKFGGHPMAAGVTLDTGRVEAFRDKMNEYAKLNSDIMPAVRLGIDCKLQPSALSPEISMLLKNMEPFGSGNPTPVFGLFNMNLESITPVGGGNHLRLNFSRGGVAVNCMKFSTTPEEFPYAPGARVDLAVTLKDKVFRGTKSLTVLVNDIKPSSVESDKELYSYRVYEKYRLGEALGEDERKLLIPDRDNFALIYRYLRNSRGYSGGILQLLSSLSGFSLGKLSLSLDILEERGLINLTEQGEMIQITVPSVQNKVDIFASPLLANILGNR